MNSHYWTSENELADNIETMNNYLDHEMPQEWEVIVFDGTYAEVKVDGCEVYAIHVSGDGDFKNHKAEFILIPEKEF